MSSATAPTAATATVEEEMKTYWCHECDMSVALASSSISSSPSTLLCPHCHTHFLELMDSPLFPQSDTDPFPNSLPSSLSLFDSPYFHHLIQHHLIAAEDGGENNDGDVDDIEDPLALLSPTNTLRSSKNCADSIPTILVTPSLLAQLDPGGVLCAVCKDPIGVDAEAKQLPCKHLFHSDCITPWLAHHNSCPLCRFRLATEEEDEGASRARRIRRQLRTAMMRLSELMEEEEEEDFYGLRTTLSHIANRHGLLSSVTLRQSDGDPSLSMSPAQTTDAESMSLGGNGDLETLPSFPVEGGVTG